MRLLETSRARTRAEGFQVFLMAQVEHQTAHAQPTADVNVDGVRNFGFGHLSSGSFL